MIVLFDKTILMWDIMKHIPDTMINIYNKGYKEIMLVLHHL